MAHRRVVMVLRKAVVTVHLIMAQVKAVLLMAEAVTVLRAVPRMVAVMVHKVDQIMEAVAARTEAMTQTLAVPAWVAISAIQDPRLKAPRGNPGKEVMAIILI